jgi:penicillin amidase
MYTGAIPVRAEGIDPRFPTPAEPGNDWKGFLPPQQMPRIRDPKAGLLANWNNKPAAWWPNYDTPVWGRVFHNEVLLVQVHKPKLTSQDLELAAWNIARLDETVKYFAPYARMATADPSDSEALAYLKSYDGHLMGGSIGATIYLAWLSALRTEIFEGSIGNFYSPDLFQTVMQPSLMLKAMERKTSIDYLGKRTPEQVASAAFARALTNLKRSKGANIHDWGYTPGSFQVPGETPVPYGNRGSYIQIIELLTQPYGRNVLPPGESETGDHSVDQVPLARAWTYKRMRFAVP